MNQNSKFITLFLLLLIVASCDQFPSDGNDYRFKDSRIIQPITIIPFEESGKYYQNMPRDPVTILDYGLNSLFNQILMIEIQYRGGCRHHTFELLASNAIIESYPPQLKIFLGHNAFNDSCSTMIHDVIFFDLEPLREKYRHKSEVKAGVIILRLYNESDYDWSPWDRGIQLNLWP